MTTLYANGKAGIITDNPLLIGGTSINSANFAALPVIAAPAIMYIILDPTSVAGVPELVRVTAHTASATVITVVRAAQGTTARQHLVNTIWRLPVTQYDLEQPRVRLSRASQSIAQNTWTDISWDNEVEDIYGFTAVTSVTLTVPTDKDGWYLVTVKATATTGSIVGHFRFTAGGVVYDVHQGISADSPGQSVCSIMLPALAAGATIVVAFNHNQSTQNFAFLLAMTRVGGQ